MFNITHLKGGALHVRVRLTIDSLVYDGPYRLEFEDPETRIWLTIRQVHPEAHCADRNMLEVFDFMGKIREKRQRILLDMPEPLIAELYSRWRSDRHTKSGICLEIRATAPAKWEWVPATVEYVWPDRQNPEATS